MIYQWQGELLDNIEDDIYDISINVVLYVPKNIV